MNGAPPTTVLVVDDAATNRQILVVFLRRLGFSVLTAENGALAVDIFRREAVDIVLMDVMMPVLDGFEATRQIKALCGERWVPVIFLSALDKDDNLVDGLDAGGDDYLHKPVNFVILEAKLRSVMRTLQLQGRLAEERARVATITDTLSDGIICTDEMGIISRVNPAVQRIFGYAPEELLGRNVALLMPEPHKSAHDGFLARYRAGQHAGVVGSGQRFLPGQRKSGEIFHLELAISESRVNEQRQFIGVVRDVTDRLANETRLRDNARQLEAYREAQELETALAKDIVSRQMLRTGLDDARVQHWLAPAANFSGDIVAATRAPGGRLYVLLADATGHGLGAAICTLPVLSVFYSLAETGATPATLIGEINRQLLATMPVGRFVAATLVCRDARNGRTEAWLGGTPALLVLDAQGQVRARIDADHLPLGVAEMNAGDVQPQALDVAGDEQIVLCSDGLIEAGNRYGEPFGLVRLQMALGAVPAAQRLASVQRSLGEHLGGQTAHDDISLLLIDCGTAH